MVGSEVTWHDCVVVDSHYDMYMSPEIASVKLELRWTYCAHGAQVSVLIRLNAIA